jgi:hypothetical protein
MGGMLSGGGGKGGGNTTAQGVSPEQQALAQYTFGQGALNAETSFADQGNVGMGESTGATQAVGGARFKEAKDLSEMAFKDTQAQNQFNQQQASALEQLAGQAGQAFGGGGGGGGGGGFSGG